jgi:hypothetical protein
MDINSLRHSLGRPEVLHRVLSGYSGPYSLGIGKGPVVILQVESSTERRFPAMIDLDGEEIPIVVKRDFRVPVSLRAMAH